MEVEAEAAEVGILAGGGKEGMGEKEKVVLD